MKIGLVPLHGWMPLTYTAAPIPAAAVLSGAAVKAGVIGLIRFLPFETALPCWGDVLVAFGFISAFYGVAIGITQHNPKTVLANSSISQMGMIAAVLGMSIAAADKGAAMEAAFYAAHHVLVKGTLFLTIGVAATVSGRRLWLVLLLAAVLALSLGGLPLTGGALAKLAIKARLGNGIASTAAAVSAPGTTLLMLHFLLRLARSRDARAADCSGRLPRVPEGDINCKGGGCLPRELRLRRRVRAHGCAAPPVAGGGFVVTDGRPHPGCGGGVGLLSGVPVPSPI
jgi:formate hydrogenlyase subunit 3/multisubunit Na+/H+ antiporter MnhD subunit